MLLPIIMSLHLHDLNAGLLFHRAMFVPVQFGFLASFQPESTKGLYWFFYTYLLFLKDLPCPSLDLHRWASSQRWA